MGHQPTTKRVERSHHRPNAPARSSRAHRHDRALRARPPRCCHSAYANERANSRRQSPLDRRSAGENWSAWVASRSEITSMSRTANRRDRAGEVLLSTFRPSASPTRSKKWRRAVRRGSRLRSFHARFEALPRMFLARTAASLSSALLMRAALHQPRCGADRAIGGHSCDDDERDLRAVRPTSHVAEPAVRRRGRLE